MTKKTVEEPLAKKVEKEGWVGGLNWSTIYFNTIINKTVYSIDIETYKMDEQKWIESSNRFKCSICWKLNFQSVGKRMYNVRLRLPFKNITAKGHLGG